MSIISKEYVTAALQAERMKTIPLHIVPFEGCGKTTRKKKLVCRLLHVKKADKVRITKFQYGAMNNSNKRSLVEASYNRFILLCDLSTLTPFAILTRDGDESQRLLTPFIEDIKLGSVLCVCQPCGQGELQKCATRVLSTQEPLIPIHLEPASDPQTTVSLERLTENYHYTLIKGCTIDVLRAGFSSEYVCSGYMCDGQYKNCACLSSAKGSDWTMTLVITVDKLEHWGEFTITSNTVTAMFATSEARKAKKFDVDLEDLEHHTDVIINTVNKENGFTVCLWSKAASSDGDTHKEPRHHLIALHPTNLSADTARQIKEMAYEGELPKELQTGQAGGQHRRENQQGAQPDAQGQHHRARQGAQNQQRGQRQGQQQRQQGRLQEEQPEEELQPQQQPRQRQQQQQPQPYRPFQGSIFDTAANRNGSDVTNNNENLDGEAEA